MVAIGEGHGQRQARGVTAPHFQAVNAVEEEVHSPVLAEGDRIDVPGRGGPGQGGDPFHIRQQVLLQCPQDVLQQDLPAPQDLQLRGAEGGRGFLQFLLLLADKARQILAENFHVGNLAVPEEEILIGSVFLEPRCPGLQLPQGFRLQVILRQKDSHAQCLHAPGPNPSEGRRESLHIRCLPGWTGPLDGDDAGKTTGKQPRLQREKNHGGTADILGALSNENPPGRESPDDANAESIHVPDEFHHGFPCHAASTGPERKAVSTPRTRSIRSFTMLSSQAVPRRRSGFLSAWMKGR